MTQRERIAAGLLYEEMGEGMPADRARAKDLAFDFNHTRPSDKETRDSIARELFGRLGESYFFEGPLYASYGYNVSWGEGVYANFNLMLVDDYTITIGNRVLIGPNVIICTSGHPLDPDVRNEGRQFSLPIVIEDDVWIGGGVVINPGVTIGRGSVIGAGSVVTKDIPAGVVAVGSPCRMLRELGDEDKIYFRAGVKVTD
ncbi:MAG: sugar O-acetyltransferase [Clostridiales Family XIII bacterium]|nr:sugar O-acetyltransferase [Clostridiales Family XIII bacterium]